MDAKKLIILVSLAALSPFAAKSAWSFYLKKTSGTKILASAAPVKKILVPVKVLSMKALEIPSSYFSKVGKTDLSDLVNLRNQLDEELKWQFLVVTGRESVDSIKNSVSADFVQRNFHDEISWYY